MPGSADYNGCMNDTPAIDYARYDHIRPIRWTGEALELLGSVRDPNGSTLAIASSGLRITYVTDGAGRLTAFNYANGRLSTITLPHAAGAAAGVSSLPAFNAMARRIDRNLFRTIG